MTATCHIYHAVTRERLFSCPCVSVEMARMIAIGQRDTLNIVEGVHLFAGYRNTEMIFLVHAPESFAAWKHKLQLREPQKETRHDSKNDRLQNQRRPHVRHTRIGAETRTHAAA